MSVLTKDTISADKIKLDYYYTVLNETILYLQDTITGLIPASNKNSHAWVRDNVYISLSIWGLSMAYRKLPDVDEDRSRGYELEKCAVSLMRGILKCYMYQSNKVESFKNTQRSSMSLHAKFDSRTCNAVVGDTEWGHLQIDAVSLFLLILAEMTASGLRLIWTVDEVAFIQNLVFYIEPAYRIPDYGIWERGDKTNHGLAELNTSSVGLAKAALEALCGLDLFGPQGTSFSTIHVSLDETEQCNTVLENMLPRESHSKETDAALLTIISYPAFAVNDELIISKTRTTVLNKLLGSYGCIRFLRDGYRTAREDVHRLHYEPWELRKFQGIECEWPLFLTFLVIGACFNGDTESAQKYMLQLEQVVLHQKPEKDETEDTISFLNQSIPTDTKTYPMMPELYSVPDICIDAELSDPESQARIPIGTIPHLWGQSLYILSRMIMDNLLLPGELDPLGRRMASQPKPDLIVQIVVIAKDEFVKQQLAEYQIHANTFVEVIEDSGVHIYPAKYLGDIYKQLGVCPKLGLTGRTTKDVGVLSTSTLYRIGDSTMAFTPQFIDSHAFYVNLDVNFILDYFRATVAFLRRVWNFPGRPTILLPVHSRFVTQGTDDKKIPSIVNTIKKLKGGYINGTRVILGELKQFETTSRVQNLSFVTSTVVDERSGFFESFNKKQTCSRSSSTRRRRLTVSGSSNLNSSGSDPADGCNINLSGSTPSPENLSMECAAGDHFDHVEVSQAERIALRRKSLALSCAISFNLNNIDEEYQEPCHHRLRKESNLDSAETIDLSAPTFRRILQHPDNFHRCGDEKFKINYLSQMPYKLSVPSPDRQHSGRTSQTGTYTDEYCNLTAEELVERLKHTDHVADQAEILGILKKTRGLDWDTGMDEDGTATVRSLLKEVYYRACSSQNWFLLRYVAGLLEKVADQLSNAISDLLIIQKQISVGLPPEPREKIIISPLSKFEMAKLIQQACGEDNLMAMLTQEIILHLSLYARSRPSLLANVLRLRTGLIIQLMGAELARSMQITVEDALFSLFSMSPFETTSLLTNLLSGKEIKQINPSTARRKSSGRQMLSPSELSSHTSSISSPPDTLRLTSTIRERAGSMFNLFPKYIEYRNVWARRRKIDGALNRVPPDFFQKTYNILEQLQGLRIAERVIHSSLTKEMTKEELKFALVVESFINTVPTPEYRQLLVEATTVLGSLVTHDENARKNLNFVVSLDDLISSANNIFLEDQAKEGANAILCCAQKFMAPEPGPSKPTQVTPSIYMPSDCRGPHKVCQHFYDTPPAGRFGTMAYMVRALSLLLSVNNGGQINVNCAVA